VPIVAGWTLVEGWTTIDGCANVAVKDSDVALPLATLEVTGASGAEAADATVVDKADAESELELPPLELVDVDAETACGAANDWAGTTVDPCALMYWTNAITSRTLKEPSPLTST